MTKLNRPMISVLIVGLFSTQSASAQISEESLYQQPRICGNYGEKIGHKALNSLGNLSGAVLELPKNVINTTNQSNVFYGFTGGLFKGIVNMAGRIGVGIADLITIPLPTKPIAYPLYVWDDFDVDTVYGDVYRLDYNKCPPKHRLAEAPNPEPYAEPAPIIEPVPLPQVDYTEMDDETSRKIDHLFKEEMHK